MPVLLELTQLVTGVIGLVTAIGTLVQVLAMRRPRKARARRDRRR
ncbi:hypothetical protein AB0J72_25085 [Dactylosporangium sp. NPDC049742]